eukprot:gene13802-19716_t
MFGAQPAKPTYNPNDDIEVQIPPDSDGISSLAFSPTANFLVATCWNNSVYCYEIGQQGAVPKAQNKDHTHPVLCSAWNQDGSQVFTGGCDKTVRLWNLATQQSQQVAQCDAPVSHCAFSQSMNMLITGSYDKTLRFCDCRSPTATLRFWDCRSPTAASTQTLTERIYAMDVNFPLAVVGTADRNFHVYDLNKPRSPFKVIQSQLKWQIGCVAPHAPFKVIQSQLKWQTRCVAAFGPHSPFKVIQSQLKWQTRCVAAFPDKSGFLVGSIEGRVAVQHVEETLATSKNFTFKCHRDNADIYAVNSLAFHPVHGTFVTAGSDGTDNFWDKDSKQRLKAQAKYNFWDKDSKQRLKAQDSKQRLKAQAKCTYGASPAPISSGTFNKDGSIYAYAISYDWSKGYSEYNTQTMKNTILLHATKEDEVKAKPKVATRK